MPVSVFGRAGTGLRASMSMIVHLANCLGNLLVKDDGPGLWCRN